METVEFVGLDQNISRSSNIFINDDVICSLDRDQLAFYNINSRASFIDSRMRNYSQVWRQCSGQLYAHKFTATMHVISKVVIESNGQVQFHVIKQFPLPTPTLRSLICGELVLQSDFTALKGYCVTDRTSFTLPYGRYFASFFHSGQLYALSSHPLKIFALRDGGVAEQNLIKTTLGNRYFKSVQQAHVVGDSVFLVYRPKWNHNRMYKLDMKTLNLEEITSKVLNLETDYGLTFHQKYLYALHNAVMKRYDLTRIEGVDVGNDREESTTSNAECPICLEPFKDPKVFSKCGHSICGSCEKKIAVENTFTSTKTLTCPECRVATVIGLNETLPTNWALKKNSSSVLMNSSIVKPPSGNKQCEDCNEPLVKEKTLNCEICAKNAKKVEVLLCGFCVFKKHSNHISSIKTVVFADTQYKSQKLGHISRDPEEPLKERISLSLRITQRVNEELDDFFEGLQGDYQRVNDQVTTLMATTTITQKAMDSEAQKVLKDEALIDTKIQKLENWKTKVFRSISKLNEEALQ